METMRSEIHGRGWTLTMEERGEFVTMGIRTLNPGWRGTDSNGHEHYYEGGQYPTLELIIDAQHWCDGHEGMYNHDPHMAVDESHYECVTCRETVEPGTFPPDHQAWMGGPIEYRLAGVRSDGMQVDASLVPEEFERIRDAEHDRDAVVMAVLDALPQERIYSLSFSR
jgi:hypothetical protein